MGRGIIRPMLDGGLYCFCSTKLEATTIYRLGLFIRGCLYAIPQPPYIIRQPWVTSRIMIYLLVCFTKKHIGLGLIFLTEDLLVRT
jgi:hypothetical protein